MRAPTARRDWEADGDRRLLNRLDRALAVGVRRAGRWITCHMGCTECCIGPFPITLLDARRLNSGLQALRSREPRRATAVERRAQAAVRAMQRSFPGDPASGRLNEDEAAHERFFERHRSLPCPALDPRTGACQLYDARPLTCRAYGPPVRFGRENLPPCRLCFVGAPPREVARCRIALDVGLEDRLLRRLQQAGEPAVPETLVAYALVPMDRSAGRLRPPRLDHRRRR